MSVRKISMFNFDEIDGRCQFHQHFTSSFSKVFYLAKKLLSQTVSKEKLCKTVLYKQAGETFLHKKLLYLHFTSSFYTQTFCICILCLSFFTKLIIKKAACKIKAKLTKGEGEKESKREREVCCSSKHIRKCAREIHCK